MAVNTLETKAHELLGQLGPSQLAVVVQLLQVMVHDEEAELAEADRRRLHEGETWFAQRGGKGIPMDDVLADFGLKPEDFPRSS